jgi:hypothetical protein
MVVKPDSVRQNASQGIQVPLGQSRDWSSVLKPHSLHSSIQPQSAHREASQELRP